MHRCAALNPSELNGGQFEYSEKRERTPAAQGLPKDPGCSREKTEV